MIIYHLSANLLTPHLHLHAVRALTRAVSDLADELEDERLCHFEVSAARGRWSVPAGSLLVAAVVLSRWFYCSFSDDR